MPDYPRLIAETPEAIAWIDRVKAVYSGNQVFGKTASAVIWADTTGPDGEQLVPIEDPRALVVDINTNGYPLLKGHDPGFPVGKVLTAEVFTSSDGATFIAAIVGYYAGGAHLSFRNLGFDPAAAVSLPSSLPALSDAWINFATDPREINSAWLEDVLHTAPLRVERTELSHNAADALQELIRLGLPYIVLVWNPFTKTIATEAGKDAYAAIHHWLRTLFEKLAELKNPVLVIQSFQDDCEVSFLFRGKDVERNYAAHEARPIAAVHAAELVAKMKNVGFAPKLIVYEFHPQGHKWFPSYAELHDGRFVTDNNILIAIEQLPSQVSLGITLGRAEH
jgi:hypothetical protein